MTITGELSLRSIKATGKGRFIVCFMLGEGEPRIAEVAPVALESFAQFRRAVAKATGAWMTWQGEFERPALRRKELWEDEVADAFAAGERAG